ncbi:MAG: vWA domain-containing protein, partial [Hyphomicrobiaceae bacterium]
PFVRFASVLRAGGFPAAPDQTENFVAAVGLLGPRGMADIRNAAVAIFAPPPERRDEFDALFRMVFLGQSLAAPTTSGSDEDDVEAFDSGDWRTELLQPDIEEQPGMEASTFERLASRQLHAADDTIALRHLRRRAADQLPRQPSRRWRSSRNGRRLEMRRALRQAVRRDGEILELPWLARKSRQRRIVLLIDVSGSMTVQTDQYLRFAHALVQQAVRVEVFTLGTRLTRVTRALRLRNRSQALAIASTLVADWDGGTRLGDAMTAFLNVPAFVSHTRGAFIVVLSDGLERGGSEALTDAVERLSRLAWSLLWLNPLAADAGYEPQTEAMRAIHPFIDRMGPGSHTGQLVDEVLSFARRAGT